MNISDNLYSAISIGDIGNVVKILNSLTNDELKNICVKDLKFSFNKSTVTYITYRHYILYLTYCNKFKNDNTSACEILNALDLIETKNNTICSIDEIYERLDKYFNK